MSIVGIAPESPSLLATAVEIGGETHNALLLDYCSQFYLLQDGRTPASLEGLRHAAEKKKPVWLETNLATQPEQPLNPAEVLRRKIARTATQALELQNGQGYMVYIAVPAKNEANNLPDMIGSFVSQIVDAPVSLLVADNNSSDNTVAVSRRLGAHVVDAPIPGVGAARERVKDYALEHILDPDHAIIVQTDADCHAEDGYLNAVVGAFRSDPAIQVGIGPSIYDIPLANGKTMRLDSGRSYGDFLGTTGLRGYFDLLGKDPAEYMLEPPYIYLIGPNTTYRASVFTENNLGYPTDGRWETLDLSVRLQGVIPSSTAIRKINGQRMNVSTRSILGGAEHLTDERLSYIRSVGHVSMYCSSGMAYGPVDSLKATIHDLETQ